MKCLSCDKILNSREATRKYASTGTYLDLCDHCYSPISDDVAVIEKPKRGGFADDEEFPENG